MTDSRLAALGWTHRYSGKVRDLYTSDAFPGRILVVAAARVSAFAHILAPGIPGKGAMLTRLSLWWFARLGMRNHLAAAQPSLGERLPPDIAERAMLVHRLEMYPVEAVVRGYLAGSGWAEYQATRSVCGIPLPPGLGNGDSLPEPIFTPARKAPLGEHDENITFDQLVELIGAEPAESIRAASLEAFATATAIAARHGLILADTKFEFGRGRGDELTLADEVLTSDSSRYWDAATYAAGGIHRLDSFDKQIVRDWLTEHWDGTGEPPKLPDEVVQRTAARYRELVERLEEDDGR